MFRRLINTSKLRPFKSVVLSCCLTMQTATAKETLVAAIDPTPPWVIIEEGDQLSGINIEIINHLAYEMNLTPEFILCPWARCLRMMETGYVDIMVNLYRTKERESFMQFIDPAIRTEPTARIYLRSVGDIEVNVKEDLDNLVVGKVRDAAYFKPFEKQSSIIIIESLNESVLIDLLLKNRIDAFVGTETTVDHLLEMQDKTILVKKSQFKLNDAKDTFIAISMKSPLFSSKRQITSIVTQAYEEGLYKSIENGMVISK